MEETSPRKAVPFVAGPEFFEGMRTWDSAAKIGLMGANDGGYWGCFLDWVNDAVAKNDEQLLSSILGFLKDLPVTSVPPGDKIAGFIEALRLVMRKDNAPGGSQDEGFGGEVKRLCRSLLARWVPVLRSREEKEEELGKDTTSGGGADEGMSLDVTTSPMGKTKEASNGSSQVSIVIENVMEKTEQQLNSKRMCQQVEEDTPTNTELLKKRRTQNENPEGKVDSSGSSSTSGERRFSTAKQYVGGRSRLEGILKEMEKSQLNNKPKLVTRPQKGSTSTAVQTCSSELDLPPSQSLQSSQAQLSATLSCNSTSSDLIPSGQSNSSQEIREDIPASHIQALVTTTPKQSTLRLDGTTTNYHHQHLKTGNKGTPRPSAKSSQIMTSNDAPESQKQHHDRPATFQQSVITVPNPTSSTSSQNHAFGNPPPRASCHSPNFTSSEANCKADPISQSKEESIQKSALMRKSSSKDLSTSSSYQTRTPAELMPPPPLPQQKVIQKRRLSNPSTFRPSTPESPTIHLPKITTQQYVSTPSSTAPSSGLPSPPRSPETPPRTPATPPQTPATPPQTPDTPPQTPDTPRQTQNGNSSAVSVGVPAPLLVSPLQISAVELLKLLETTLEYVPPPLPIPPQSTDNNQSSDGP